VKTNMKSVNFLLIKSNAISKLKHNLLFIRAVAHASLFVLEALSFKNKLSVFACKCINVDCADYKTINMQSRGR